jgi:hypothetical protein
MRGDVLQRPSTSAVLGCAGLLLLAHSCPSSRQPQPFSLLQCGTAQPCLFTICLPHSSPFPPTVCSVLHHMAPLHVPRGLHRPAEAWRGQDVW